MLLLSAKIIGIVCLLYCNDYEKRYTKIVTNKYVTMLSEEIVHGSAVFQGLAVLVYTAKNNMSEAFHTKQ